MGRIVVVDTSVLINFCHAGRLDHFGAIHRYDFVLPAEVEAEVLQANLRSQLETAFERGDLSRTLTNDPDVLSRVADLLEQNLGLGEAACTALAAARGWLVACDERRRFLRIAETALGTGRVLDTPGLLLTAIREGLLSVAEADAIKAALER